MRFFTTEGPVNCADHYCLPPLSRLDMEDVLALIGQKKYFLLHAPRQTVVQGEYRGGRMIKLDVQPAARRKDVVLPIGVR